MLQKALSLQRDQAEAIKEAHGHFLARQRALALQRGQALPVLQKGLYSSCDLATHNYMGCATSYLLIYCAKPAHLCRFSPPCSRVVGIPDWRLLQGTPAVSHAL